MLLGNVEKYEPCGIFTLGHLILVIVTILGIIISLKKTASSSKEDVKKIIKTLTIILWIFEIIVISFKIKTGGIRYIENYVPLYYCSILLYAGLLSSFGKNKLKRMGDVFLATGGIIGGIIFIIFPTTSLPTYPMLHFVSLHSFLFHGIMVYLGILLNVTNYIELKSSDIKYYATLVGFVCILAYIINQIFDSNLMFISKNFPGTLVELLYNLTGPFFTIVACIGQMTLPFYIVNTGTFLRVQKSIIKFIDGESKTVYNKNVGAKNIEKEF